MDFLIKILGEHAVLTLENTQIKWQLEQYEFLLNEMMLYLCQEDVLAKEYIKQYNALKETRRGWIK